MDGFHKNWTEIRGAAHKELSRSADTKGKAHRALERAISARPGLAASAAVKSNWTIEQLAGYWLEHRRATGLVKVEGDLRAASLRQMEDTVRTAILGDRKTRVGSEWKVVKRRGGIPHLR